MFSPEGGERDAPLWERAAERSRWLAALVCALLGAWWASSVSLERSWGWDESMHAELPAARMLVAVQAGEPGLAFDALLDCQQYPFVHPVALAVAQAFTGLSERTCRVVGRLVWALGCFGLYLLGEQLARRRAGSRRGPSGGAWIPWLALAFGALSPLALAFSGTLFLEIPFVTASIFALRAWLRRDPLDEEAPRPARDVRAGAWLALCFFVKFNYGLLLGAGLALETLVELVISLRERRARIWARRTLAAALVPVLALAWWFLLPLPAGAERALQHREAFLGFLQGNQGLGSTAWTYRAVDWACSLCFTPRVLAVLALGALASLGRWREPGVRTLWIVFLALFLPIALHPFHLDRFLLPVAVPLWCLAAVGWSSILPQRTPARIAIVAAVALAASVAPAWDVELFADGLGPRVQNVAYRNQVLERMRDLRASRSVETNGLLRGEAERVLALLARELQPAERFGWIGGIGKLSPAAIHIGLLQRGGSRARFLRDAHQPMLVCVAAEDPHWSREELLAFAQRFDAVFATDPPDLGGLRNWEFLATYRDLLQGDPGWESRELGQVALERVLRPPQTVRLFVMRPKR
jgi:hypothetical protein